MLFYNHHFWAQNTVQWNIQSETQHADPQVERLFQKFQSDTIQLKNDTVFQSKCENLKEKLAELGYFDALLTHQKKTSLYTTTVKLNSKIETIYIQHPDIQNYSIPTYATLRDKDQLMLPIEKSKDYLNVLTEQFQNTGYPFVKIKLIHLMKKENQITAQLNIDKGKLQHIDQIIVKGYEQFPRNFLKYKLQLTENQIFNKSQIENLSSQLQSIGFISEIRKPEILFTRDTTYLYLYLQKEKSNSIDGIIGFSNAETGKGLRLNGHLDLILHNAFNKGENLELNWNSDGQKSQSLQTEIDFPFIFNTPFLLNYKMEMYKRDSTFFNINNQLNLGYLIKQNHRLGFEWNYKSSRTITEFESDVISDYMSTYYGVTYNYTVFQNSKYFPIKTEINNRFLRGNSHKEQRYIIDFQGIYNLTLSERSFLSLENQTALMIADQLLGNELFLIGGIQSIRGFREKSLSSQKYSFMKTGYHYTTSENSYLSLLSDWGLFKKESIDFIYNLGIGYKMGTSYGNFQIQYFISKQPDSPISLNHSFLHLNFSQNF